MVTKTKYDFNAAKSLTTEQIAIIESNLKRMKRSDIAHAVGVSESRLKRAAKVLGWKFEYLKAQPYMKYSERLTKEVLSYYEKNGKNKTQNRYPDIKLRSIIERYKEFNPRQINWTDEQI